MENLPKTIRYRTGKIGGDKRIHWPPKEEDYYPEIYPYLNVGTTRLFIPPAPSSSEPTEPTRSCTRN